MKAEHLILSRLLPKTGQLLPRAAGDDGDLQKGWWKNQRLNGELPRFVDKTVDETHLVLDRATGLMWASAYSASINYSGNPLTWLSAVAYPRGREFAGFDDWRLPNVFELVSLINYAERLPAIHEFPFMSSRSGRYWSSTTQAGDINKAWDVDFIDGIVWYDSKIGDKYMRAVRGGV